MSAQLRTAFLIAPIGDDASEARKRTNRLQKYILEPALTPLDMRIVRADMINAPGLITRQIMEQIIHADLVISDLSDLNANVFYEMGIRHALQRPIIHLRFENSSIPFDISAFRTISYDFTPEGIERCIPMVTEFCSNIDDEAVDNPFSSSTQSYLVLRGDNSFTRFRSLDVVHGLNGQAEQWRYLVSIAEPGIEFWTQAVGSTSFPEDGEDLMAAAIAKGATFKFILKRNPPFSGALAARLDDLAKKTGGVEYVFTGDADLRVIGMSEVYCLVSPRIDGVYGGIIIKDQNLIRHLKAWFDRQFFELRK